MNLFSYSYVNPCSCWKEWTPCYLKKNKNLLERFYLNYGKGARKNFMELRLRTTETWYKDVTQELQKMCYFIYLPRRQIIHLHNIYNHPPPRSSSNVHKSLCTSIYHQTQKMCLQWNQILPHSAASNWCNSHNIIQRSKGSAYIIRLTL